MTTARKGLALLIAGLVVFGLAWLLAVNPATRDITWISVVALVFLLVAYVAAPVSLGMIIWGLWRGNRPANTDS